MATNDIVQTVTDLRNRGVEFLRVPNSYYDDLLERVGHIDEDLEPLKELGVLVDRDNEGYLLQIFTKPLKTGRHYFLRSSSEKERRVLVKEISKHCLKPLKGSKVRGGICSQSAVCSLQL
jgi:4-hydroxyphenylpyruvate dioxygenase